MPIYFNNPTSSRNVRCGEMGSASTPQSWETRTSRSSTDNLRTIDAYIIIPAICQQNANMHP